MYCDKCGARLTDPPQFCPSCGKSFTPPRAVPHHRFGGRVARHASILGVLWIAYSVVHLIPAIAALFIGAIGWPFMHHMDTPFFVGPLIASIGGFMGIVSILGIAAGISVRSYRPWSRVCLLVLAFFALFSIPLGTALGIYTLWVLFPSESDIEFSELAHPR